MEPKGSGTWPAKAAIALFWLGSASTTTAAVTPPAAPSNLVVRSLTPTTAKLTWTDNASNETGFSVELSADGQDWTQAAVLPAQTASYQATGLAPTKTYRFRVLAYAGGVEAAPAPVQESPDGTRITPGAGQIVTAEGKTWKATPDGRLTLDSVLDAQAGGVTEAVYVAHTFFQKTALWGWFAWRGGWKVENPPLAAPLITSAPSASATVGSAFGYQIAATNNPTSFNATGLPSGLSLNTLTGVISGVPTAAASSSVGLSATNGKGTGTATLALTVAAQGAPTITVDKNGSVKTIQQAVNMAKAGDVILIKNGTYKEAVTINVSGTASGPITIRAEAAGSAIIDASGLGFGVRGGGARYIHLKGIKINNANSGTYNAATLLTGANWVVEDVEVNRSAGMGIYVAGDDSVFRRTYARDCAKGGWWSDKHRVQLLGSGATGSGFGDVNPATGLGGIKVIASDGWLIDGGEWSGNALGGIWFDWRNKNFVIRNAHVHHNTLPGAGIITEANDTGVGLIENNDIHDNGSHPQWGGISVWESTYMTIRGNTLVRNGIVWRSYLDNGHRVAPRNNTVTGNRFYQGTTGTPPAGNVVSGNIQLTSPPVAP